MVSKSLQLQLLVTDATSKEQRSVMVKQIALLHPSQKEVDVTILVWDGTTPPHSLAGSKIRLYAAPEVSMGQTANTAVTAWQRNWRVVPRTRVTGTLQKKEERWVPMFVCLNKADTMKPNFV